MAKDIRDQKGFRGNREHLDVLLYALKKNDIGFWNRWREEHGDIKVLLTGAHLSNAVLGEVNFSGVDLREADLSGAALSDANLNEADLSDADLSEAVLTNAKLSKVVLDGTYLYKANLTGVKCIEASFNDVNLSKSSLKNANLDLSKMRSTDLTDSDLRNSSLSKAFLEKVTFTGANVYSWNIKTCRTKALKCDYIYIDKKGAERLPQSRSFRPGEFEGYIKKLQAAEKVTRGKFPEGRALNHVFLSYADEDYDYVKNLADTLEINGIKVWLDKERLQPGLHWQKALKNAIVNGIYFIACFTKNYCSRIESDRIEELKIAFERLYIAHGDRTWFIPVKLLRCDVPDINIGAELMLKDCRWIDLSQGWNEGLQRIVDLIKG
jgi:hypothetical protein